MLQPCGTQELCYDTHILDVLLEVCKASGTEEVENEDGM